MGKDDEQAGDSRSTPATRKASLVLSGLVLTPDSALEVFRERRATDPKLDVAHLRRARDILDALHHAIVSAEPDRWSRIAQAWRLLSRDAAPIGDDDAAAGADAGPGPAATDSPALPVSPGPPLAAPGSATSQPAPVSDRGPSPVMAPPPMVPAAVESPQAPGPQPPVPAPVPPGLAAVPGLAAPRGGPQPMAAGAPASIANSPWASAGPSPAPPPARPPAVRPPARGGGAGAGRRPPPPVRAGRSPARPRGQDVAAGPRAGFDVDALNQIELDEDDAATLAADGLGAGDGVLPFRTGTPKRPPAPLPVAPAASDLGKTLAIDEIRPSQIAALPFKSPVVDDADATRAIVDPPAQPVGGAVADLATAPTERLRAGAHALPGFEGGGADPLAAHLAELSVEHYAALCAECAVHPQQLEQIHQRYHVASAAQRAALDAHWRRRMAQDDNLTREFQWHYPRYEQWARQQQP